MCGIIGVLAERSDREPPAGDVLLAGLQDAVGALASSGDLAGRLAAAASALEAVDGLLRGTPGVRALVVDPTLRERLAQGCVELESMTDEIERMLDADPDTDDGQETVNAALVRVRDASWAIRRDRLRNAEAVAALAGAEPGRAAVEGYAAVQIALSALDRLEIRGRDSAGLHLFVEGHGIEASDPELEDALRERSDPLFTSGSLAAPGPLLSFVYKVAAEIGELGDNTRRLREAIASDGLLRRALSSPEARLVVLGHTRWASVGIISEPNAHPLNSDGVAGERAYVVAALNGDIDNHAAFRGDLVIPAEITTDAKIIPCLVAGRRAAGASLEDAFRSTVASFEGSVAIAAHAAEDPGTLLLALRGSGQALYVGLAEGAYIVASEPYGLVEETSAYLRMDGETPNADGVAGQVLVLRRKGAGTLGGIARFSYDGTPMPVEASEVRRAEITTRDIDRADQPHFLLKEIGESPRSVRKTLRGKIVTRNGRLAVSLPASTVPSSIRDRLASGAVRRVVVIGQGTAAVAGQAVALALSEVLDPAGISVAAVPATELSGFGMDDDMSDVLVVAISQSGTTTDTNRTVDLARARGACVIAIVNRRNSDLVEKSHGVLYTSDGRDVEMAVPSTKAFYAQVAAGFILACGLADVLGAANAQAASELLSALRELPDRMQTVLQRREQIAEAARALAPPRRYWAVVGNGANRVAAQELRIKLSELCYKSISWDVTEDKKHIDLSSEPLIIVCTAGLEGPAADDVAKEIAIYRAHNAAPVVIATEGVTRYGSALRLIEVPPTHPSLGFVLSAMAGHLFGYEAAVAIDAQSRSLREVRSIVERVVGGASQDERLLEALAPALTPASSSFFGELRTGAFNGHLEASTAVALASMLRYATGVASLEGYEVEYGRAASPAAVVEDLLGALTRAIDELTRPIDAIKHQAKTVTVGISRSEDAYFETALVRAVLKAGVDREALSYRALRTLAALDPAVEQVTGYTRYLVEGDVQRGATIRVVDRGGIAVDIPSRTDADPTLRGTKHRAAFEREVTVARGGKDGRTVILVPEVKDNQVVGLTLVHAAFAERLDAARMRTVLAGYRGRYGAIVDAVTEAEPVFRDEVLAEVPVIDLLVEPVYVLAGRWRSR